MQEYSYFLAEGRALDALEMMKDARNELGALKRKLCAKVGAHDLMGGYREDMGRFNLLAFCFNPDEPVPAGWDVMNVQKDGQGKLVCTFATPAAGSPDHFTVASLTGLMERASRRASLEGVFGCTRFMRDVPAGNYETAFVRESCMTGNGGRMGRTPGTGMMVGGSSAAGRVYDPLVTAELNGRTYLRVPNKPGTEDPVFVPPDARPMSFDAMMKADADEEERRRAPAGPSQFYGC